MAQHKQQNEQDPEIAISSAIGNVEAFIMKSGRSLLIALIVIIVVVGGFFGYKYLIMAPRGEKAAAAMFSAEQQFAKDSFRLALEGDGNFAGFLEVIEKYGSTPAGNLANHYTGICYLKMGDPVRALEYLKKYKASTDNVTSKIIAAQNYGLQGDANIQNGNYEEAVKLFEKAVATSADPLTAPYYLKKAGETYEKLGKLDKALEAYKSIATDYAGSMEARDIQKYIGNIQQKM